MICVGGILAWKYQEVIKDSLNWFDNEITISSQVIRKITIQAMLQKHDS